jgi:CheY-like chemotaxis protein
MRILVVEDENITSAYFKNNLESWGYKQVTTTRFGRNAIEHVKKAIFDLVLLDIGLPDITGIEVANFINENSTDTKIVYITAHSDKKTMKYVNKTKHNGVLVKPVGDELFKTTIDNLAGKRFDEYKQRTCWNFFECEEKEVCPAYPNLGQICFMVKDTACRGERKYCENCEWYTIVKENREMDLA